MTYEEAINIISEAAYHGTIAYDQNFKEAMKKALEAIRFRRSALLYFSINPPALLPYLEREALKE